MLSSVNVVGLKSSKSIIPPLSFTIIGINR